MTDYEDYTRERRIKKSNFSGQSAMSLTDTLDFVRNGQNYKITFANFLTAMSALGTIDQLGEVTGYPVLKKDSSANYIRNLLAGPGVIASSSPEDGIKIGHAFVAGDSGTPILIDIAEENPVIRNLVPGDGVSIAASGDNIVVSVSGVPAASNVVIVNEMSDFPTAVTGVITLGDDSAYLVSADLSTSDRFVAGNNSIVYAADSSVGSLTYTGTGVMFTSTVDSFKLTQISLTCADGQLFAVSTAASTGVFQLVNVTIPECDIIGTITDLRAVQFTDVFVQGAVSNGVTFSGDVGVVIGSRNLISMTAGIAFDLGTATINSGFSLSQTFSNLAAGAVFLSGLADSGNLATGTIGTLDHCNFKGAGTVLANITQYDSLWEFTGNNGITDSITSLLALHDTATITISATDTPVIIGATWTFGHESRFEGTSGGRFTYTGKGAHTTITASITAELAGGERNCTFMIYKNGSAITGASYQRALKNGDAGSIAIVWQEDFVTGDYIELFVENNENTENVEINAIQLAISGQ